MRDYPTTRDDDDAAAGGRRRAKVPKAKPKRPKK
jgi:hypothetical protein